jgi:hypothetical protein
MIETPTKRKPHRKIERWKDGKMDRTISEISLES